MGLNLSIDDITEIRQAVENDDDPILFTCEPMDGDILLYVNRDFERAGLVVATAKDVATVELLYGIAPMAYDAAIDETAEAVQEAAATLESAPRQLTITVDLADVAAFPVSLNRLMAQTEIIEPMPEEADAETDASDNWVLDYDASLLSIEKGEDGYALSVVAPFDQTVLTIDTGDLYTITLLNGAANLYPAATFSASTDHVVVNIEAPDGAFPVGTAMVVADVADEDTISSIADKVEEGFVRVERVHAVDITFVDAKGVEIEPLMPVSVVMSVREIEEEKETVVVHVDHEGEAQVVEETAAAVSNGDMISTDGERAMDATALAFTADTFSVYAVVVGEKLETKAIAADGNTYRIEVTYSVDADIPAGAGLAVAEVTDESYLAQVQQSMAAEKMVTLARFFDIRIMNGEEQVQPAEPVMVKVELIDDAEKASGGVPCAVHFTEHEIDVVRATEADAAVSFRAEHFSVWGVVYTVDFEYTDEQGNRIAWKWPGQGSYSIASIMAEIGVEGEATHVSLARTEDMGGSEKALYLSEDATELISEAAFKDIFELTVVVDGKAYVLIVTDQCDLTSIATVTTSLEQTTNLQRGQTVTAHIYFDISSQLADAKANAPWVYDLSSIIGSGKVFSTLVTGQSGNLMKGTDILGTYAVSQDGKSVTITPSQNVLDDTTITEIQGEFNLDITLNEEHHKDASSSTFQFPGGTSQTTISYVPKTLTASKHVGAASNAIDITGTSANPTEVTVVDLGDGTYKLYYRINFYTSTKPYALSISDALTGGQSLVQDSVRLGLAAESGNVWGPSVLGANLTTTADGFTLNVVGALDGTIAENTAYFVTYEAIIDAADIASQSGTGNKYVTFNVQHNSAEFTYDTTAHQTVETHIRPEFVRELQETEKVASRNPEITSKYDNTAVPVRKDQTDGKYYIWFQTGTTPNAPATELKMTDIYTGVTPDLDSLKIYIGGEVWEDTTNSLSSYITESSSAFTFDVLRFVQDHSSLGDYLVNGQQALKAGTDVKIKYRAEVHTLDQPISNSAAWDWQYEDETITITPTPSRGEPEYYVYKEVKRTDGTTITTNQGVSPDTQVKYYLTVGNQYENGDYASMAGVTVTDKIDNYIDGMPQKISVYDSYGEDVTEISYPNTSEDGFTVVWNDNFQFNGGDFWSSKLNLFSLTFPAADATHDWCDEYTISYTVTIADWDHFGWPDYQLYGWMTKSNYGIIGNIERKVDTNVIFPYPGIHKSFDHWDDENDTAVWNVHVDVPAGLKLEDGVVISDINATGSKDPDNITEDSLTIQSMTVTSGNVSAYTGKPENARVNQYALNVAAGTFTFPKGLDTSFDFRVVTRVPRTLKSLEEYHATNTGRIDLKHRDFDSTATANYYNSDYSFEKTGAFDPLDQTTTWTVVLNADMKKFNASDDYEPIFYDTLPEGMVLDGAIQISVQTGGNANSYGTALDNIEPVNVTSASSTVIGPINLVTALRGSNPEDYPTGLSGMKYTIVYKTKLTDAKLAEINAAVRNYDFTNRAEVRKPGSDSAEKTAEDTVQYKYTDLVNKYDRSADIASLLEYEVDINKSRRTLNGGEWITLSDRINTDVTLVPATVQVYEAKDDGDGNWLIDKSAPVTADADKCIISYDEGTRRLEVSVPDGNWYSVCFSVLPNAGEVRHDYVNTVTLSGRYFSQNDTVHGEHTAASSGTMTVLTNAITIQKVDKYSITKRLAGAEFDFYRCTVDPGTGEIVGANKIGTGTTGANGQLRLSGTQGGVLYYWLETQAPDDYQITSSTPHYFTVYQELADRNRVSVRWGSLSTATQNALKAAFPNDTLLASVTADYHIIIAGQGPDAGNADLVREYHDNHYFYLTGDAGAALKTEVNSINRQEAYDLDDLVTNYYHGNITVASISGGYTWQVQNIKNDVTTRRLSFTKTMNGRAMSEGEFSFYLYNTTNPRDVHWVQTVTNPAAPAGQATTMQFDQLSFTIPGTYTYRIYEKKGDDPKITYDEAVFDVTIEVTRDEDNGRLVASEPVITKTPKGESAASAEAVAFTNVYESTGELILTGTKTLTGRDMLAREFNFLVKEGETTVATGANRMASDGQPGEITFTPIAYTSAGNHTYTITEDTSNLPENVTGDSRSLTINVSVTSVGNGHLIPTITGTPTITFSNTFTATGSLTLEARKALTGKALEAEQFSFTLTGENEQSQTKRNDANGAVTFDPISYAQNDVGKTYVYTVKEVDPRSDSYTWDQSEYEIHVTVIVNPDDPAQLTTQKTIYKVKDSEGNAIEEESQIEYQEMAFENAFIPDKLTITKTLGGNVSPEDMTEAMKPNVSFTISGGGLAESITKTLADFTLDEGVFTLTLTENEGIQNDQTYTVTESATDTAGYTHTTTYRVNSGDETTGAEASVPVNDKVGEVAFINTYTAEMVSVPVNKAWVLLNEQTTWPDDVPSVTVQLMRKDSAEGTPVAVEGRTLTLNRDNPSGTFEDLPKYKFGTNQAYIYSVKEAEVAGFTVGIAGDQENGYTITNTEVETLSLGVRKVWDDTGVDYMRPSSITVQLYSSADSFAAPIAGKDLILDAGNNWQGRWTRLDLQYTYKAQEIEANGYTVSYAPADGAYTVTADKNTSGDVVTITNARGTTPSDDSLEIKKVWVDDTGAALADTSEMPDVTFTLNRTITDPGSNADSNSYPMLLTLTYPNWYAKVTGLDKVHNTYTLTEYVPEDTAFMGFSVNGGTPVDTNPLTLSELGVVIARNRSNKGSIRLKKVVTVNNRAPGEYHRFVDGAYQFSITKSGEDEPIKYVWIIIENGSMSKYNVLDPERLYYKDTNYPYWYSEKEKPFSDVGEAEWITVHGLEPGDYVVKETESGYHSEPYTEDDDWGHGIWIHKESPLTGVSLVSITGGTVSGNSTTVQVAAGGTTDATFTNNCTQTGAIELKKRYEFNGKDPQNNENVKTTFTITGPMEVPDEDRIHYTASFKRRNHDDPNPHPEGWFDVLLNDAPVPDGCWGSSHIMRIPDLDLGTYQITETENDTHEITTFDGQTMYLKSVTIEGVASDSATATVHVTPDNEDNPPTVFFTNAVGDVTTVTATKRWVVQEQNSAYDFWPEGVTVEVELLQQVGNGTPTRVTEFPTYCTDKTNPVTLSASKPKAIWNDLPSNITYTVREVAVWDNDTNVTGDYDNVVLSDASGNYTILNTPNTGFTVRKAWENGTTAWGNTDAYTVEFAVTRRATTRTYNSETGIWVDGGHIDEPLRFYYSNGNVLTASRTLTITKQGKVATLVPVASGSTDYTVSYADGGADWQTALDGLEKFTADSATRVTFYTYSVEEVRIRDAQDQEVYGYTTTYGHDDATTITNTKADDASLLLNKVVQIHADLSTTVDKSVTNGKYTFTVTGPNENTKKYVEITAATPVNDTETAYTYRISDDGDDWSDSALVPAGGVPITGLVPGVYTITEAKPALTLPDGAGMYLKDIDLPDHPGNAINIETRTAKVAVGAGGQGSVSVTYTNEVGSDTATMQKMVLDINDSMQETAFQSTSEHTWEDTADYDIGDLVPYRITATLPQLAYKAMEHYYFRIEDKMQNLEPKSWHMYAFVKSPDATAGEVGHWYQVDDYFTFTVDDPMKETEDYLMPATGRTDGVTDALHYLSVVVKTDQTTNGKGLKGVAQGKRVDDWGSGSDTHSNVPKPDPDLSNVPTTSFDPNHIQYLQLRYNAELLSSAVIGGDPNKSALGNANDAILYFDTWDHPTNGAYEHTDWDRNRVYTYKLQVNKTDGTAALSGASFRLYKKYMQYKVPAEGSWYTATYDCGDNYWSSFVPTTLLLLDTAGSFPSGVTGQTAVTGRVDLTDVWVPVSGTISQDETSFDWDGIDDGSYCLFEITAPKGYQGLPSPMGIGITATHEQKADDDNDPKWINGITNTFPEGRFRYLATGSDGMFRQGNMLANIPNTPYPGIGLIKIDETTRDPSVTARYLAGAQFKIEQWNGSGYEVYRPSKAGGGNESEFVTTSIDGKATFPKVEPGEYKIIETRVPDGYVKMVANDFYIHVAYDATAGMHVITRYNTGLDDDTDATRAVISEDVNDLGITFAQARVAIEGDPEYITPKPEDATVKQSVIPASFTVGNTPGASLPATGGPGTTVFNIMGSILTLLSAALLIAKKRTDDQKIE